MDYREVTLDRNFYIYNKGKYDSDPFFYNRESGDRVKIYYYSYDNKSIYYHSYKSEDNYDFIPGEVIYHISEIKFHQKFASKEDIRDIKLNKLIK